MKSAFFFLPVTVILLNDVTLKTLQTPHSIPPLEGDAGMQNPSFSGENQHSEYDGKSRSVGLGSHVPEASQPAPIGRCSVEL